jgi:arylsulfatase
VLPAGRRIDEPVSLVDLTPTVLDLLGIGMPPEAGSPSAADAHGRSLAAALRGDEPLLRDRPIYLHRRHYEPRRVGGTFVSGQRFALRRGDWKLILAGDRDPAAAESAGESGDELYRLSVDPRETTNVAAYHPEVVARLRGDLEAWRASLAAAEAAPAELSEEERAALEALGYVE